MKALSEIGYVKAFRFLIWPLVYGIFRLLPYPPLRAFYLRLLGSEIGANTIIHSVKFFNYYRGSFRNLKIGDNCFLGSDVLLDLAAPIIIRDNVTIAERTVILTHSNVGYADHPLQRYLPAKTTGITIESGSFIGVNAVLLCGVKIGPRACVGSLSLVDGDIPPDTINGGVPTRLIRKIERE